MCRSTRAASTAVRLDHRLTIFSWRKETRISHVCDVATNAKKRLVRKIQQDSLKQLSLATQAVLVRSPTEPYHSYHMTITSEYYKQKWIACHRYSDFYRLRKTVLEVLSVHARMGCPVCQTVHAQVKKFDFPPRDIFRRGELDKQVAMRLPMLEDFVVALCQYLSTEGLLSCPICLNDWGELDGNQLVYAQCGHFFHEHCINEW
ncbi:hypothetical protein DYB28_006899 [Aphanomyces astaci]|uniref:RING-type domain-containing protein n=1 Tax=Aphanomyces astaci TaxID=112090 RepID=A0A397DEB7_APHAT|nr:hypothetical protein DYB25_004507 [Aphanomyces astaci]RHY55889.1 hypothetical protein DYB38_002549 [Aphanomyces astaci]RHY63758.1 hypothetical protein DYB30_003930 [Aphanomyces astaci]RHY65697.1 hypothetical protein DYB34_001506 [Aphanomyces astaci]RHZ19218.1 hypothetical protein DYB31_009030 [Aphanomyces astaci]